MSTPSRADAIAANRAAWDASADYHRDDPQWRALLEGFATPGFSVLDAVETAMFERLDVAGKAVAQLCCNNAREVLSVKNLGASRCVGFDQSANFIEQGRELAAAGGIDAELVVTDVYAIDASYDGGFDVVLVTIGAIGWMPDLPSFMTVAARLLRTGGHLFMHEQHPIVDMFDPHGSTPFEPTEPYFTDRPYVSDEPIVYHGQDIEPVGESYWYTHTLADIFRACLGNGLAIREFDEYPDNISTPDWAKYEQRPARLPLSYALLAQKE